MLLSLCRGNCGINRARRCDHSIELNLLSFVPLYSETEANGFMRNVHRMSGLWAMVSTAKKRACCERTTLLTPAKTGEQLLQGL